MIAQIGVMGLGPDLELGSRTNRGIKSAKAHDLFGKIVKNLQLFASFDQNLKAQLDHLLTKPQNPGSSFNLK